MSDSPGELEGLNPDRPSAVKARRDPEGVNDPIWLGR